MTDWNNDTVRQVERASIRAFVESCSEHLTGRVLDYGCGQQPYRDVVEAAGGDYHGYDRLDFPGNVSGEDVGDLWRFPFGPGYTFGAVLCNQVVQYVPRPYELLGTIHGLLTDGLPGPDRPGAGHLILTGPTNWAEVEPTDLHRYTLAGIKRLVEAAGFWIVRAERRASINLNGFELSLGYGILARRA